MNIQEIISFLLLFIVLVIGVVCYSKLTTPFRLLALSIPATLILDLISKVSSHLYKTNAWVLHLECLVLYVFYSSVYYHLFQRRTTKKVVLVLTLAVVVFAVINALFLQPVVKKTFPSYLYLVTNTMLVIYSLLLFKQMLLYPVSIRITSQGVFWFNTSMLFFSTTMFLNLGLINYYAKLTKGDDAIYYFWYGSYYILYILTGVALLCNYKEKESKYA
jgi:hypothetical protein